jgi:hypothetical protein
MAEFPAFAACGGAYKFVSIDAILYAYLVTA